jgi:hypothetical protein
MYSGFWPWTRFANTDLTPIGRAVRVAHDIRDNAILYMNKRAIIGLHAHHTETWDPLILGLPWGVLN